MKSASVASLLLLMIFFSAARGIRLEKGFFNLVSRGEKIQEDEISAIRRSNGGVGVEVVCQDERCLGKMKKTVSMKKPHHWFTGIQEDYYGPRSHRPRHH